MRKLIFCVLLIFGIIEISPASKVFSCADGNFILYSKTCDGNKDCPDYSDETPELCADRYCPGCAHRCESGACVSNQRDCPDLEDLLEFPEDSKLEEVDSVALQNKNIYCPAITSKRYRTICKLNGIIVSCNHNVRPGTVISYSCMSYFEPEGSYRGSSHCQPDGTWSTEILPCSPKCGQMNTVLPLIVNGIDTNSPLPWHATMFMRKNNKWVFACGGTLISEKLILSAAHCFTGLTVDDIKFFIGKIHNKNTITVDEINANVYRVDKIIRHPLYLDKIGNYGSDIAIVQLNGTVEFDDYIHPACIDWNLEHIITQLKNGSVGLATGMGINEHDVNSENIRVLKLPVVSDQNCIEHQTRDFRKYVRLTTFCGGWANGTGLCNGDSGGGLVFFDEGTYKWYIQGVVSLSPRRISTFFCDPRKFTVFTKVGLYLNWIKQVLDYVHSPHHVDAEFFYEPIL